MNIDENEIRNILGNDAYLEPEILSAVLRFTLAFSYSEHKIMGEYAETRKCDDYAQSAASLTLQDVKAELFYFQNRYAIQAGHEQKLAELCNGDKHSEHQILKALSGNEHEKLEVIESLFRICLRLRHNLFHGRKWSYMLHNQIDNLNHATDFLVKALRVTGN